MMEAIETEYKGYRFRSRLEARWAVFFDAIGAKWEYEPEGFTLEDGTLYLPDFLVHDVRGRGTKDMYIEVKGKLTEEDLHKVEMFKGPIIIFGQIPDAEWREWKDDNGRLHAYWDFDYTRDGDEAFYNLEYSEGDNYTTHPKAGKGGGLVLDYPDNPYNYTDSNLTEAAFRKARQARFEHDERGNKKPEQKAKQAAYMDEGVRAAEVIAMILKDMNSMEPGEERTMKERDVNDCLHRVTELAFVNALNYDKERLQQARRTDNQSELINILNALTTTLRSLQSRGRKGGMSVKLVYDA